MTQPTGTPPTNTAVFEIKQYMIIWRQVEKRTFGTQEVNIRGIVRCIGDEFSMDVLFLAPDSVFPQPIFEVDKKKGYMFMPISDLLAFTDMLRNEHPVYGHLRGDRPDWTSVTTSQEPVGEGEAGQAS
ncbi:MAG: hypothetical protein SF029_08215 [bacterium]|nr:hypothetical protein [bacterium]